VKVYLQNILLLLKRLGFLLIAFQISRLLFLVFNLSYFADNTFIDYVKVFFYSNIYDISSILLFNLLFVVLSLLPFNFIGNAKYQFFLKIFFLVISAIILLPNFADIEYFKFTNKRTTFDVFSLMFVGEDLGMLLPQFILDFWYIIALWILLVFLLYKYYPKNKILFNDKLKFKVLFLRFLLFFGIIALSVFLIRGFGLRPISINSAAKYTKVVNIPLVINSPFSIVRTVGQTNLTEINYFSKEELIKIFNPIKKYENSEKFNPKNVVIIILESFGKDYTGFFNKQPFTPFLDSLIGISLYSNESFANGKTSMQALPSIIAGIPSLSENPFITSLYSSNKINSLPNILKTKGYYSAFFHGGINGTMGFDNFAYLAGFDKYYGKTEYANNKDYDGNWGIYDEPFLKFYADKMSDFKQPFLTSIFTLSSHHPYNIPEKYKNKFKGGDMPIHKAVEYSDYSLKQFFKYAKTKSWYNNTIFVLVADHTSQTKSKFYNNNLGTFCIPIIFYTPDGTLVGETKKTIQQIDILPTILDYLHYNEKFYAIGNSVLKNDDGYAINYLSGIYRYIEGDYTYWFDGKESVGLYNIKNDKMLKNNLLNKEQIVEKQMQKKLKAIIQTYNNSVINNKLTVSEIK
jgi:phosphoglycerol transferase MdoB-like AlkP superfamily enzyme